MTHYQALIAEATGCNPADGVEIEEIMREDIFHGTLDWVSRKEFMDAAREAAVLLNVFRAAGLVK